LIGCESITIGGGDAGNNEGFVDIQSATAGKNDF
jgi:hypothetical protein